MRIFQEYIQQVISEVNIREPQLDDAKEVMSIFHAIKNKFVSGETHYFGIALRMCV